MSRPLTPDEIRATFRAWSVPFRERSGWTTRSNSSNWLIDGSRNNVTGVMYHHTGDAASDSTTENLLVNGRSDLPGPLCNFMAADDGYIVCIAAGSANHAGKGDPDTLALLKADAMPLDRRVQPDQHSSSAGSVGGNSRIYGWESAYGGTVDTDPNVKQHRATLLSMAAIIHALDKIDTASSWSGGSMLGHREWTDWKPDPQNVDLPGSRRIINALLQAGPSAGAGYYATGSVSGTTTTEGDDSMSAADVTALKAWMSDVLLKEYTLDGKTYPGLARVNIETQARVTALRNEVAAVSAKVDAIADPAELAAALAPLLPDNVDEADLKAALRDVYAEAFTPAAPESPTP